MPEETEESESGWTNPDCMDGYHGPPFHVGDVAYIGRNQFGPHSGPYTPVDVLEIKEVEGKRICRVRTKWKETPEEIEIDEEKLSSGYDVWD